MVGLNYNRKIFISLFLTIVLTLSSTLIFTAASVSVSSSRTENIFLSYERFDPDIIIPDDYNTIQEGINNSNPGDTLFVRSGIYKENVIVNKERLTIIGENKFTTVIDAEKTTQDAMKVSASNVKVQGFTFTNAINERDLWNISGLRINSSDVIVTENRFIANRLGVSVMSHSYNLTISNNSFIDDGIFLGDYINSKNLSKKDFLHTIEDNTVNGKPLYYYANSKDITIPEDGGQVILANCTNVTIHDMYISNTDFSVILGYCRKCTIENITVSDTDGEVILLKSCNNVIQNNQLINNLHGICLDYKSNNNTIRNNYAAENLIGISAISSSSYNHIYNNNVTENNAGIYLSMFCCPNQHDNIIKNNNINNTNIGIDIKDNSRDNLIEENTIKNCNIGIRLKESSDNEILNNIFKKNIVSALFFDCKKNIWDNNYWDRPRILPKMIFGYRTIGEIPIPWINIDKNPSKDFGI